MTKEQLQAAVDDAAKTQVAQMFSVLVSNLMSKDAAAGTEFKSGVRFTLSAHAIATSAVESL